MVTCCAVAQDMSQIRVQVRPQWGPLFTCWQERDCSCNTRINCCEQISRAPPSVINWHRRSRLRLRNPQGWISMLLLLRRAWVGGGPLGLILHTADRVGRRVSRGGRPGRAWRSRHTLLRPSRGNATPVGPGGRDRRQPGQGGRGAGGRLSTVTRLRDKQTRESSSPH